ncbi:MAG: translation initiation factor IF-2 N-terminal domain-containing protein, partial [Herbinix sp.]|nr:translation initiation factor IF-2 N-terminal domain-containing protein [Herbinix sp.]
MSKKKIFEIKNEINDITRGSIESKDILDFLEKSFGVKKTHSSNLEDNEVQYIKNYFVHASKSNQSLTSKPAQEPVAKQIHTQAMKQPVNSIQRPTAPTGASTQAGVRTTETAQSGMSTNNIRPEVLNGSRQVMAGEQLSQGSHRPVGGQNPTRQSQPGQQNGGQTNQRPTAGQNEVRQGQSGQQNGQRTFELGHQGTPGQRPAGGQGIMKQEQQGYQSQQSKPAMESRPTIENKPSTEGSQY